MFVSVRVSSGLGVQVLCFVIALFKNTDVVPTPLARTAVFRICGQFWLESEQKKIFSVRLKAAFASTHLFAKRFIDTDFHLSR